MTNPYYSATGNPPSVTRGASPLIRTEYLLIQQGFDGVTNAIAGKGAISGQNWTGTHDYTAGTLRVTTQAVGDNSNLAASTGFVQALAAFFAAQGAAGQLPNQTGNADKLFTTDGSLGGWTNTLKASVIKFKDGTDATKLLAFDLSALTTATTRTIAIPNKSGTMALISDTALTLLATLTPTASSQVNFLNVFSSSYDNYLVIFDGLIPSANSTLNFQLAFGGVLSSSTYYNIQPNGASVTASSTNGVAHGNVVISSGNGTSGSLMILNVNSSSDKQVVVNSSAQTTGAPAYSATSNLVQIVNSANATGIGFFWPLNSANFTAAGKIRVYGIQN